MQRFLIVLIPLVCSLCCGRKEAVVEEPSPGHTVTIQAGDIRAVFVDNTEFGAHRAWYNGVASLTHKADTVNIFRPRVAGLNFEHIFDGAKWWEPAEVLFEPRACPMIIKKISDRTVELHQPPTELHKLESWTRFTVTEPHYIDMEFTCIPRAGTFDRGYIGLFWASYINTKMDKGYYFIGRKSVKDKKRWIEINSPAHNIESSVRYELDRRDPDFVEQYPPRRQNGLAAHVRRGGPGKVLSFTHQRGAGGSGYRACLGFPLPFFRLQGRGKIRFQGAAGLQAVYQQGGHY